MQLVDEQRTISTGPAEVSAYGVLVVDDEPAILQSLSRVLQGEGYALHTAADGPTALDILQREPIAVIICDQKIPRMTGDQVLAEAYRLRPDAVRISLTGATALAAAQSSINAGHAQYLLLKPWDDDHVRSVVRESIKTHHVIQERNRLETLSRKQQVELEDWNRRLEQEVQQQTDALKKQNEELSELQTRVEQSLHDTVAVLAGLLDMYSPNLGMHAKRVAQNSRLLAEHVGMRGLDLRDVEFAAFLHDIGKIRRAQDDHGRHGGRHAASSPSRPAEAGYSILSRVNGFEEVARAVRHQAERFDGGDPPGKMRGEIIPLASRIIAVANTYDEAAFRPNDPTRISPDAGRRALARAKGKQLDPELVDHFIQNVLDAPSTARDDVEVEVAARSAQVGMVLSRPFHNAEGLLLLQKGTELTHELIEKIRVWCDADPLLSGLFVRCESPDPSENGDSTPASQSEGRAPTGPVKPSTNRRASPRADAGPSNPNASSQYAAHDAADAPPSRSALPDCVFDNPEDRTRRVLVADDSAFIRNALKRELRRVGIEVSEAADGLAALNLVRSHRFDAALVDLRMPRMSGEELVAHIREVAPRLRCVILTGNATLDSVLKLLNAPNVAGILTKPWNPDRLISTLQAAMEAPSPEPASSAR